MVESGHFSSEMNPSEGEHLADIKRALETFFHQDWTIEGSTLEEVFENNYRLEGCETGQEMEHRN